MTRMLWVMMEMYMPFVAPSLTLYVCSCLWRYYRSHSPNEDCSLHLQCLCPAIPDISHTHQQSCKPNHNTLQVQGLCNCDPYKCYEQHGTALL